MLTQWRMITLSNKMSNIILLLIGGNDLRGQVSYISYREFLSTPQLCYKETVHVRLEPTMGKLLTWGC